MVLHNDACMAVATCHCTPHRMHSDIALGGVPTLQQEDMPAAINMVKKKVV